MTTPFIALLDLDRDHLPPLRVRIDERDYALRSPEALTLTDALHLSERLSTLQDQPQDRWDAAIHDIVRLIAPSLPSTLQPGAARRIVAFYSDHLARAAERLATPEGLPVPFSTAAPPPAPPPASPPASDAASGSN